jgi:hypothetical protein
MWFDARAKLSEIVGETPATSATQTCDARPASQVSRPSQPLYPQISALRVAEVASVATPPAPKPEPKHSAEIFQHGVTFTGQPKTWTGRIVSLEAWRILTEWEKHGPNGRYWNGNTKKWEEPK